MGEITHPKYILGHSPAEVRRLILQASILRPITERLLSSAKLGPGMRVLDLGCGAGDVSMLAAEFVGPSGAIVGIDRSPEVIAAARARARTAGLQQVDFASVPLDSFSDPVPFDCVIGRCVLVHQTDPANFIRRAARFVRPGGTIAFHEIDASRDLSSCPSVWRWNAAGALFLSAFREMLPHYDVANRLIECFSAAGLPTPNLFREVPIGGGIDSPLYAWIAETLRSVSPQLIDMGLVTEELTSTETFETPLRSAVVEARSQIEGPAQVCAWTKIRGPWN